MVTVQFRHNGRNVAINEIKDDPERTILAVWGNRIQEIAGPLRCPDCGDRCWVVFLFSAFEQTGGTQVEDVCHEGFLVEIEKAFGNIEGPLQLAQRSP